ncbi:MAG: hypothetical protein OEX21_09425, partial [Betaproteobacteria bacterium]|nr:hypothetical protein [Betaproteobacteria bacterium]
SGTIGFNCDGENPCRGTWVMRERDTGCTNDIGRVGSTVITGLSLSSPGPIAGTITWSGISGGTTRHTDGFCSAGAGATSDFATTFTGYWNGSSASLTFPSSPDGDGGTISFSGTLSAVSRLYRLSGSFAGSGAGSIQGSFTCEGENPCTGNATVTFRDTGCSNTYSVSDTFGILGLSLAQPGSIAGGLVVRNADYEIVRNPDGTCTMKPGSFHDGGAEFTGTWNGSSGSFSLVDQDYPTSGSFTATTTTLPTIPPPPVFPMTVDANIGPTVSSATANIQYRPQDVGSTGSVFVFAVAPSSVVKSAADGSPPIVVGKALPAGGAKADAVACVLSQLNASGELQAVTASSVQAYVTGVLSAQGQAVSILNGVPTVNIGGATFYVGYGTSSAAMIESGINRSAVTVPGTRVCKPQPPQTGWWWNPDESGRGFSIEASGNNLFMAAYLYDVSGRSTWHVAVGPTSLDGSLFNGRLLTFGNGVTLTGPYRANTLRPDVGPISLAFDDESHGTLVWPGGTMAIQRFPVSATGPATPALGNQPESGWWWGGAADDGRGFFIEWQGANAFLAGYMYDTQGNATWYVAQNAAPITNARSFQGAWLQLANGQTLTGAYRAPTIVNANVAPVTIQFQGADTAILTLPSGTLPLTRFRF